MKYKIPSLDLHGIYQREVDDLVHNFLNENLNNLPVEIITGNSERMKNIVKEIIESYNLTMQIKSHYNLGSFIIS